LRTAIEIASDRIAPIKKEKKKRRESGGTANEIAITIYSRKLLD